MTVNRVSTRRKGRIGHSKSRNGCPTCKIRRVKCDEEKPQCYRCTSTGRRCDYKTVNGHDLGSWSGDSSTQNPTLLVMDSRPSSPLDCSSELRAFGYLSTRGMPIFPGALNRRFWKTCVLQACHTEPIIWDAVISLSALFEHPRYSDESVRGMRGAPRNSPRTLVKDRSHQQALMWYNRSLSKLRTGIERGTVNSAVALITCILYICIELLQDNVTEVTQLYHRGADIISNCNASLFEECVAPLFYNISALAIVMDYITPDKAVKPILEVRNHFSDLEEAGVVLYQLMPRLRALQQASAQLVLLIEGRFEEHQMARLEAQKDSLSVALDQWLQRFQALGFTLEGDASHAEKFAVAELLQAHATLRIAVATSTSVSEMANDDLIEDFEEILHCGRYGIAATRYPDGTQPHFSLETGIALPLFICVIKCRDYRIRHEALDLLWQAPRVQGLCKSASHALMASKIVRIEEAGLELFDRRDGMGSRMFIPESHRITDVAVTSKETENGGHEWALTYSRFLPDDDGGYRIVKELSPFDSLDTLPA